MNNGISFNLNGATSGNASKLNYQKPVPVPTVPKSYTPSAASAYRLASLERLTAHRQRTLDQQIAAAGSNGILDSPLQSKRELFFKNELPSAVTQSSSPAVVPSSITTSNSSTPMPSATSNLVSKSSSDAISSSVSVTTIVNSITNNTNSISTPTSGINAISHSAHHNNISYKDIQAKRQANEKDTTDLVDNKDKYAKVDKGKPVPERQARELDGYVGFANFPNQVYRKAIKKGFEFSLMVVGESGLGKSTLIDSLFLSDVYCEAHVGPSRRIKKTVQVETSRCLLKENGVNLILTIVDTPGFGDAVDNSNCWQPVIDYIESRYEEYLNAESRVNRKPITDTRVHCCLYFIAPSGHGLKPLDVEFMQRLHDKVNIIPIISKADTMTPEEIASFKKQILNEIAQHKIQIYEFPEKTTDTDLKRHKNLRDRVPFAVVGSNTLVDVDGKKLRGRRYPWGVAEVENLEHCDFIALRDMMIRTHLQDIKDVTNNIHYENYRCRKLAGLGTECVKSKTLNKNPLAQMEEEKREHENKMKKMEAEMDQVFESKVKEKKQKLKDSEADLQRRHEQMKKSLENQIRELEEKKQQLEAEKLQWEQLNGVSLDELRRRSLERDSSLDGKEKKNKKKGLF